MSSSTYCHMCDEYWEDCDCAASNRAIGFNAGRAAGFEAGVLHVLSRVAREAACEDCGEDIWFLVPASRLPRTPGTAKTKPLRLTWHVYDGSGTRHNCLQRKERLGAEP